MTDEELRSALMEVQEHMLHQFPDEGYHCEFSPRFHRKMKRLIRMERRMLRLERLKNIFLAIWLKCASANA